MKYLYLVLILSFISCDNKLDKIDLEIHYEKASDSLLIKEPDNINSMEVYWEHRNIKNIDFLIDSNYPLSKIFKYNIIKNNWQVLNFNNEGPNGIGSGTGFYVHNLDSVFIFSGYQYKMFLFNNKTEKVKTYKLPEDFSANIFTNRKCALVDNHLFIPGTEYIPINKEFCSKAKLLLKYNLANREYKKIINYPKKYIGKKWMPEHLAMDFIIKDNKIISSFGISNKIHIFDLDGNLLRTLKAKSEFINTIKSIGNINDNSQKSRNLLYENGYYSGLLYDDNKKLYYRFAYHLKKDRVSKNLKFTDMTLSVIVLNEDMKRLGEFIPNKASGYYKFINKKGLVLSINPKYLTDLKEGERKFYIYKYEKK